MIGDYCYFVPYRPHGAHFTRPEAIQGCVETPEFIGDAANTP
jgi:hypothetical protein